MIRTAPPDGHLRALHAGHAWRGRIAASAAGQRKSLPKQTNGELAERSNAAVLKTVSPRGLGGSNPSLSARSCPSKSKDVRLKPISLYENRLNVLTHPNRSGTVLPPSVGRNGGRNGACNSPPVGEVGRENQAAGLSLRRRWPLPPGQSDDQQVGLSPIRGSYRTRLRCSPDFQDTEEAKNSCC